MLDFSSMNIKITLVDPKEHLINEWKKRFRGYRNISYHYGKFQEIEKYDCLINAGNGFGMLDGGVDAAISEYYGQDLQRRVQEYIRIMYHGEQPVGTSFIIPISPLIPPDITVPLLAHTPTMRAPTIIRGTENVYLAFRAALLAIEKSNCQDRYKRIRSVVCVGLGTSCGGMEVEECARQMFLAYRNMMEPAPKTVTWPQIKRTHKEISTDHKGHCLDYLAS